MDERSGGGGGFVHTSKFASFMTLKIVVYIDSYCIENVFRLVGLGCRRGPSNVDVCSDGGVWAVWQDVGSGESKMSNGWAVGLEWRWSNGLTIMGVLG